MVRKLSLGLLLCMALLLFVAAQGDKRYSADRFDVDIVAQHDRSLLVEETVVFRFQGGPFSYVFRELPTDHTDGITGITAGVDGEPWPEGTGPGQVEITGKDPIVVTWHLSPTADTVESFNLSYQAHGVVRQDQEVDVLDWQALPDEALHWARLGLLENYPPARAAEYAEAFRAADHAWHGFAARARKHISTLPEPSAVCLTEW